jgi:uncharacterized PurR-regulated membrane protein YhhQ (DUF165 family)
VNNIYPIVVPAGYFDLPPEARKVANSGLEAFGIVRPMGNDLFSLLVQINDGVIRTYTTMISRQEVWRGLALNVRR